jgi:hypothetical protein
VTLHDLRRLRESVEANVFDERVEATLAGGVYAYVGALLRLVEDGDREPGRALREARAAVAFLATVPRLPPARPRTWRPS